MRLALSGARSAQNPKLSDASCDKCMFYPCYIRCFRASVRRTSHNTPITPHKLLSRVEFSAPLSKNASLLVVASPLKGFWLVIGMYALISRHTVRESLVIFRRRRLASLGSLVKCV